MSNLVPKQRDYTCVPQWLVRDVPGFAASPEYASLESHELALPGVVCGAFSRFLTRLQEHAVAGKTTVKDAENLAAAYQAVETLASSSDPEVINAVVVEIFENLDSEPRVVKAIQAHLGRAAQQLYEKWVGNGS